MDTCIINFVAYGIETLVVINSVDPDKTPHPLASELGLQCFLSLKN